MTGSNTSELAFFTNQIIRNVIPCKTIGNVHDGSKGVRSWGEKNGFKVIFDFSTHQLSKVDLSDLTRPDVVVAHNAFGECATIEEMVPVMELLDMATRCIITAVPTKEHHEVRPPVLCSVELWRNNLSQLGSTVEVYHCDTYSMFLTLK